MELVFRWGEEPVQRLLVEVKNKSESDLTIAEGDYLGTLEKRERLSQTLRIFLTPLQTVVQPAEVRPGMVFEAECRLLLDYHQTKDQSMPKLERGEVRFAPTDRDIRVLTCSDRAGPVPLADLDVPEDVEAVELAKNQESTVGFFRVLVENVSQTRSFKGGEVLYLGYANLLLRYPPEAEEKKDGKKEAKTSKEPAKKPENKNEHQPRAIEQSKKRGKRKKSKEPEKVVEKACEEEPAAKKKNRGTRGKGRKIVVKVKECDPKSSVWERLK